MKIFAVLAILLMPCMAWADTFSQGYNEVQDEGTAETKRRRMNFIGAGVEVADDSANGRTNVTIAGGSGSGDVTAAANMTDHTLIRGDGGAKGIQDSGITVDDSDNITGVGTLSAGATTVTTLDTGQGANELYDMDQNVLTTSSPTFAAITGTSFVIGADTLDTNEWAFLDGQDQAVATTSSPSFATSVTLTGSAPNYKYDATSGSDWETWVNGSTWGLADTTNSTQHLFVNSTGLHTVTQFTADNGVDLRGIVNMQAASVVSKPEVIFSKTLAFPDLLQAEQDNWNLFTVEAPSHPFGLTITKVVIQSDASTTLTYNLEEWTSPTDGSPTTITPLVLTAATENTYPSGLLSDKSIAAGSIIMVDLDTTDLSAVTITVWGYANTA